MIVGLVPVLVALMSLLAVLLLVRTLVATVRNDGYGQRPPPARLGADPRQQ